MLIVNLSTPYQMKRQKNEDFDECSQLKTRSKRIGRREKLFSQQILVPKIAVVRKEEGATAAASHLPSPWRNSAGWSLKGRTGCDSQRRFYGKDP